MSDNPTYRLKLLSSHDETGNVRTFVFESGGHSWIAGQSQAYILKQAGESEDDNQRWFTIASSPQEGVIHISTRITQSKFKQSLNAMKPGNEIEAFGIDGEFVWEETNAEPVILVAGGIGITPFRSILLARASAKKPLNATLLYFNRDADLPFQAELENLEKSHPEFVIRPVVGQQITADAIIGFAPKAIERRVFLSGPEPMVEAVGTDLKNKGIEVMQDWFPGYDEKNY